MPKEEWGVKRLCPESGKRFYDLNKDPIVSPYTGTEYPLSFFTEDKSKASLSDKADKASIKEATDDDLVDDVDVLDDLGKVRLTLWSLFEIRSEYLLAFEFLRNNISIGGSPIIKKSLIFL